MDISNKITKFFPKVYLGARIMWKNVLKLLEFQPVKHDKISSADLKKKKHNHWLKLVAQPQLHLIYIMGKLNDVSKRRSHVLQKVP